MPTRAQAPMERIASNIAPSFSGRTFAPAPVRLNHFGVPSRRVAPIGHDDLDAPS